MSRFFTHPHPQTVSNHLGTHSRPMRDVWFGRPASFGNVPSPDLRSHGARGAGFEASLRSPAQMACEAAPVAAREPARLVRRVVVASRDGRQRRQRQRGRRRRRVWPPGVHGRRARRFGRRPGRRTSEAAEQIPANLEINHVRSEEEGQQRVHLARIL